MKINLGHELRRILSLYQEQEATGTARTPSGAIRDLMIELVHICDEHHLDPDERFDTAIEGASRDRIDATIAAMTCEHGRLPGYGCCDMAAATES